MRISVLLGVLGVVLGLVSPQIARACSCMAQTPEQAIAQAAAIFEGRVVSLREETEGTPVGGDGFVEVRFAVTRAWKGVRTEEVVVRTATNSAACGYAFEEGKHYLVYAYEPEQGRFSTGLCSRTRLADGADEDLAALGAGVTPVEPTRHPEDTAQATPPGSRVEPASSGGCAGCAVAGSGAESAAGALLLLGLLALARRRSG